MCRRELRRRVSRTSHALRACIFSGWARAHRFRRPSADARSLTACDADNASHRSVVASTRASRVESGPRQKCSGCSCKLLVPLGRAQGKPATAKGSYAPHEYHLPPYEQHPARCESTRFPPGLPRWESQLLCYQPEASWLLLSARLVRVEATIPWRTPSSSDTACAVAVRTVGSSGLVTAWQAVLRGAKWGRFGACNVHLRACRRCGLCISLRDLGRCLCRRELRRRVSRTSHALRGGWHAF